MRVKINHQWSVEDVGIAGNILVKSTQLVLKQILILMAYLKKDKICQFCFYIFYMWHKCENREIWFFYIIYKRELEKYFFNYFESKPEPIYGIFFLFFSVNLYDNKTCSIFFIEIGLICTMKIIS